MTLTRRECYCVTWVHLSFLCFLFDTNGSLDTSLLEKKRIFDFKRTIFAKLFDVKASLSNDSVLDVDVQLRRGSSLDWDRLGDLRNKKLNIKLVVLNVILSENTRELVIEAS